MRDVVTWSHGRVSEDALMWSDSQWLRFDSPSRRQVLTDSCHTDRQDLCGRICNNNTKKKNQKSKYKGNVSGVQLIPFSIPRLPEELSTFALNYSF